MTSRFSLALIVLLTGCVSVTKMRAERAFSKKQYDKAITHFGALAAKQPSEKKWQAAVDESRRHSAIQHIGSGRRHIERGDLSGGVAEFDLALTAYKDHPVAIDARNDAIALGKRVRRTHERAKLRARVGDCVQALELIRPIRKFAVTDPDIGLVHKAAAERCSRLYKQRGDRFLKLGNFAAAEVALSEADALTPNDPQVRALKQQASSRAQARVLTANGRALLDQGQWEQALGKFEEAAVLAPGYKPAKLAIAESKRIGTVGYLASGARALERRDYVSALRQLKAGRRLAKDQPKLAAELDRRAHAASRRLAAAYAAKSRKLRASGLPGAALVYARLAKSLAPDMRGVGGIEKAALRDARQLTQYQLGVVTLRNDRGERGAGVQLTNALASRLGKQSVRVVRSGKAHGVLTGEISSFSVEATRPTTRDMQITYVAGEVTETNPSLGAAMKGVGDAQMEVWTIGPKFVAAEKQQASLDQKTNELLNRANGFANKIKDENINDAAMGRKPKYHPNHPLSAQLTAAQNAYRQAKAESDNHRSSTFKPLKQQLDLAKFMLQTRQLALDSTPPTLNRPVENTHYYKEVRAAVRASAQVEIRIDDKLTRSSLVRVPLSDSFERGDTAVVGFAPAGLRDDPMSLPHRDAVRAELVSRIADAAAPRLAAAAKRHGDRFVGLAETKNGDLGLHYRVLAILSKSGDREALAKRIRDEHGLRWDKGTARLRSLPKP